MVLLDNYPAIIATHAVDQANIGSHVPIIGPGIVFLLVGAMVFLSWLSTRHVRTDVACPICGDPQGEGACEAGPCL